MCVSALALTSLDAVARIGRMSFQELFSVDEGSRNEILYEKIMSNKKLKSNRPKREKENLLNMKPKILLSILYVCSKLF